MKKLLALIISIILIIGIVPLGALTVGATTYKSGDFQFEYSDEHWGLVITKYIGNETKVTVPDELYYEEYECEEPVVGISENVFKNKSRITDFDLPDNLYYIGENAFTGTGYYNDNSNWQDNVLYIDNYLITAKKNLGALSVKEGTTLIAAYALKDATSMISVSIPGTVTTICQGAFYGCDGVTKVYGDSLNKWLNISFSGMDANPMAASVKENYSNSEGGAELYLNNKLVTNVKIEVSGEEDYSWVSSYAFAGCSTIQSVDFSDGMYNSVDEGAFIYCLNLKKVTLSEYNAIEEMAFYGCKSLDTISESDFIGAEANAFTHTAYYNDKSNWENGILYLNKALLLADYNASEFTIKEGTNYISAYAFSSNGLKEINIPESVLYIGEDAFRWCDNLKTVYAKDLASWTKISFENGGANPLNNGAALYFGNKKVTSVKIVDDEDTYIASYAFAGCSSITSITVSTGAYVGYDAFVNCENIKTVNYVLGSSSVVSSSDFSVPYTVEKITIGKGITDIEEYAFAYMSSLKEVSLPTTLKKIGDSAFYSCSALTEISIPKGVTDIGIWAFGYCTALEKVVIPSTLKSMGSYAFDRCEAIGRVYISDLAAWCKIDFSVGDSEGEIYKGDNPMDYGADLYINKALATDIVIPSGIKKIEGAAFSGCTSMVSLTIPQGVTEIGEWAFLECLNLKYINLPSSLSDVADTAFNRTFAVKHVNYAGTEARWNDVINRDFEYDGATVHYLSDGVIKNKIKKATTSENGYSYYHCSECSAKLSSKKTIAKIKTVKLSTTSYTYNGEVKTPTVTVKDSNGKTLKKDVDYTVNYASGRKYVGKYTVKVTFKGNYSGSKTLSFTIKPAKTGISSLSAGSKRFTAKWSKKTSQTTGYQIQYSRYSSFAKDKIKTISGYKNTSATIKGLSGSKTYYVRIRTYKSVDGKRYYSDWSSAKKVKTKK